MIPLVAPTITPKDRNALASFAWTDRLNDEREVRRFEEAFAERVGCAGAVAVASGTEALRLSLSLFLAPDEVVYVPTYACSAIENAVRGAGGVAFYRDGFFDVRTAQMTQEEATVLVHSFGRPTRGYGEMEDWTLSLGAFPSLMGKLGVCSTHASKMLSTGRGGVVFSNDTALLDEVRALAFYDSEPNGRLGAYSLGMSSMQAAIGRSQLAQLDDFIAKRRELAAFYSATFEDYGIECPHPDCGSVFFRYLIAVDNPADKVERLKALGVEAGRGVYPPLHQQLGLPADDFPGATAAVNSLLSVPCHPSLTDKQVRFVAEKVLEVCA